MQVLDDGYEKLNDAIESASVEERRMTTKAELVEYYQKTYPGKGPGGWRDVIQRDLSLTTGTKYNSVRRQFDPSRINNQPVKGSKNEQGFIALGKQIPKQEYPKDTRGKGATVDFYGHVCIPSSGKEDDCRDKKFTRTLTPSQANSMKRGNLGPVFQAYDISPKVIDRVKVYDIRVNFE